MSLTPEKAYEIWIKLSNFRISLDKLTFDLFEIFGEEFTQISQKEYEANLWLKTFYQKKSMEIKQNK